MSSGLPSRSESADGPRLAALPRPPVSSGPLPGRMTDSRTSEDKPTVKQLRYLRALASSRGESFRYPQTRREASAEIDRLKGRGATTTSEQRREVRDIRREVSEGRRDASAIRPEEIEGYGSSATWR